MRKSTEETHETNERDARMKESGKTKQKLMTAEKNGDGSGRVGETEQAGGHE